MFNLFLMQIEDLSQQAQVEVSLEMYWSFVWHFVYFKQCSHQAAALRDSRKKKLKWRIKTKKMRPLGRRGKLRVKRT